MSAYEPAVELKLGAASSFVRRAITRGRSNQLLLGAIAIALLGLGARLLTGPPAVTTDATQALYWGREIIHGHLPTYIQNLGITPHPLWVAYATVCVLLGSSAPTAMSLLFYVSAGAIVWGGFRLGSAIASPLAGILTALILATSGTLLLWVGQTQVDVPFAAIVLWALVLEAERPRRGTAVLVLLSLAGLLRPDAWILSALYWLYLMRAELRWDARLKFTALALAAPVLWTGIDLLITGDPFFSLKTVQSSAEAAHVAPMRLHIPVLAEQMLSDSVGTAVVVAGIVGGVLAIWRRDPRALPIVAVVLTGLFSFALSAGKGIQIPERYLVYIAVAVAALAGYAIGELRRTRRARSWLTSWTTLAAVGLLLWLIFTMPTRITGVSNVRPVVHYLKTSVFAEVAALAKRPADAKLLRACGQIATVSPGITPEVAWSADLAGTSLRSTSAIPRSGPVAYIAYAGSRAATRRPVAPAGFRARAAAGSYVLYTRGC